MNPPCPDCGSDSRPVLDRKEGQVRIDPDNYRNPRHRLPLWECIADGSVFVVRSPRAVPDYDDRKEASAGGF